MLAEALPPHKLQQLRAELPPNVRVEVSVGALYNGQAAYLAAEPVSLEIVNAYGASLIVNAYYSDDEQSPAETNAEHA
jgi:hypothetical protein